jgi:hypothetical protein
VAPHELTPERRERLLGRVTASLRSSPLRTPADDEGETLYTTRCLAPLLAEIVSDIAFPGLVPLGAGFSIVPCHFLGMNFWPDLGIAYFGDYVLAIEVKFLRTGQRQNSIATAIGQSVIYRQRYRHVSTLLIDTVVSTSNAHVREAATFLAARASIPLIVRRAQPDGSLATQTETVAALST